MAIQVDPFTEITGMNCSEIAYGPIVDLVITPSGGSSISSGGLSFDTDIDDVTFPNLCPQPPTGAQSQIFVIFNTVNLTINPHPATNYQTLNQGGGTGSWSQPGGGGVINGSCSSIVQANNGGFTLTSSNINKYESQCNPPSTVTYFVTDGFYQRTLLGIGGGLDYLGIPREGSVRNQSDTGWTFFRWKSDSLMNTFGNIWRVPYEIVTYNDP